MPFQFRAISSKTAAWKKGPARPLAFGLLIDVMGSRVLMVSSALSLSALLAVFLLKKAPVPA